MNTPQPVNKVLLLSCSTGQGHNSCAQAIKEYFEGKGLICQVKDAFDFISDRFSEFMSWGHSFIYRYIPGLFRTGYGYSEKHPGVFHERSLIYKALTSGAEGIYRHIEEFAYDTVICTHVFSAMMLTRMMRLHPTKIKTAFVATDYTCYPGMDACDLRYCFIPDDALAGGYIHSGISPAHIFASGIPIRQAFYKRTPKEEARQLLGLPKRGKHLLIACGSMGCGPIFKMVSYIAGNTPADTQVSVICGTNRRLRGKLERRYGGQGNIHIIGYTDKMPLYLDSADLYLTKPGGISITEAAAKGVPMAFVNAVAGCELYNMEYFEKLGGAISANTAQELADKCLSLLRAPADLLSMEAALRNCGLPNGAEEIYRIICEGSGK